MNKKVGGSDAAVRVSGDENEKEEGADSPVGDGMFSAASFADVISSYSEVAWEDPERPQISTPIVAFYGFRGGAGRSTAMAHLAAMLASKQISVVAIDLDLEAPGLHHILDCPSPEEGRGMLSLLRAAATTLPDEQSSKLRLAPHLLKSRLDLGSPIRVIPAGLITERYLVDLEDLGVPLWHIMEGPSPLKTILDKVQQELQPQVIFLDCRTGLSDLSASALFHVADVVVCFLPVSEQSLEGFGAFLKGVKASKVQRSGRPDVLIVPAMVPEGPEGRQRLEEWFLPQLDSLYLQTVLGEPPGGETDESVSEIVPIVREGVEYRRGIALADHIRADFIQRSAGVYQGLLRRLEPLIGLEQDGKSTSLDGLDVKVILEELKTEVRSSLAFAEEVTGTDEIVKRFTRPTDFKAIIDRVTWYIVGAKGAGKTWLWKYLLTDVWSSQSLDTTFIPGHGPGEEWLSTSAFRELESDKTIQMKKRQLHGTLWLLYAVKRLLAKLPNLVGDLVTHFRGEERRLVQRLAQSNVSELQHVLTVVLRYERVGTMAERLIHHLDEIILHRESRSVALVYDGLDVGFGSDRRSIEMRNRYVGALVAAIEPFRGICKRIHFKLFLREDIYAELRLQNQSHLAAATVELRWEPRDLWVLALDLVSSSPHYLEVLMKIDASAGPVSWPQDEERRQRLLVPLWGAQMERGRKISTAFFVQRRTADGKGRLFPRTLVQLLAAAIEHQGKIEPAPDRVLRSVAIQAGYDSASKKRVEDLRNEYAEIGVYLDALANMAPTGTAAEIQAYLSKRMPKKARTKKGVAAGALHAGPGGWRKVIEGLLEIGVLREYKRARGDGGEQKYEISLLYRPGLGIKAYGI